MIEHEGDRAGLGEVAAGFVKAARTSPRAVRLSVRTDDDGDAARPIALVADFVIALASPPVPLDGRSILSLGMFSARAASIAARRRGFMRGSGRPAWPDRDLARELAEQLEFTLSCRPCGHDVLELGMAGQLLLLDDLLLDGPPAQ